MVVGSKNILSFIPLKNRTEFRGLEALLNTLSKIALSLTCINLGQTSEAWRRVKRLETKEGATTETGEAPPADWTGRSSKVSFSQERGEGEEREKKCLLLKYFFPFSFRIPQVRMQTKGKQLLRRRQFSHIFCSQFLVNESLPQQRPHLQPVRLLFLTFGVALCQGPSVQ